MKNAKKTNKKSGDLSKSPPNSSRAGNNQARLKKKSYPRLFLQSIVDSITLPIVVIGTDMRIKFINHAAELIAAKKTKTSSHVGEHCYRFMFGYDTSCVSQGKNCPLIDSQETGETVRTERRMDIFHDFPRSYEIIASSLCGEDGTQFGIIEIFNDITNLKEIEEQLRTERDKLKGMMSAIGQGIHILNHNYDIEYQNDIALQTFGDHKGEKCYRVYKGQDEPCDVCAMHTAIATNSIQRSELLMANGKYYEQSYAPFKDVDGQTKMLILLRDITEQKALQAETMRAAQLASVGELAAGVAHEINNPINGIINYAQIIQDESGGNQFVEEISGNIISEGERVANIVKNLLSFARQSDEGFDKVFVDDVVSDAVGLINHQLTKNCIILEMALPSDLPPVFAHHQQLQQVFLNLFSNAYFALNQRYAGKDPNKKIIITGEVIIIEGKEYVRVNCKDLGTGIPHEVVNKIFEPFFSSKKPGEGTGLGLSISHGIIKKNNGFLHVETEFGRYTNMIVDLPAYREKDEQSLSTQEDFAVKGR